MSPTSPAAPSLITGAILAGGRGLRMGGVDKGWVAWRGVPLVEQVVQRLRPQVGALWISANRNIERYAALGAAVVRDDAAGAGGYAGPLAGMLAVLEHAGAEWVAFVPCDAPQLPVDLVARLAAACAGRGPAVASTGGILQPVFCLLPRALAPRMRSALARGEGRLQDLLRGAGAVEVPFADASAFVNINEPECAEGTPHA